MADQGLPHYSMHRDSSSRFFPRASDARECLSDADREALRRLTDAADPTSTIWLSSRRIGLLCDPPLDPLAIEFRAVLGGWRSRTRPKPAYLLSDAIRDLSSELGTPLIEALLGTPKPRHLSDQAVMSALRRRAILCDWLGCMASRKHNINKATHRYVTRLRRAIEGMPDAPAVSRTTLFRWRMHYEQRGLSGLLDGRHPKHRLKQVPAMLWRAFCRAYQPWAGISHKAAYEHAITACPAEVQDTWRTHFPPSLLIRRLGKIPFATVQWCATANAAPAPHAAAARLLAALARSNRLAQAIHAAASDRDGGQP